MTPDLEGLWWGQTRPLLAPLSSSWMEACRMWAIVWCSSHPPDASAPAGLCCGNNGAGPKQSQLPPPPPPTKKIFSLPLRLIRRNQSSPGSREKVCGCPAGTRTRPHLRTLHFQAGSSGLGVIAVYFEYGNFTEPHVRNLKPPRADLHIWSHYRVLALGTRSN